MGWTWAEWDIRWEFSLWGELVLELVRTYTRWDLPAWELVLARLLLGIVGLGDMKPKWVFSL